MAELRRVSAQALVLDPTLVGRSLAPPWRRGVALALDAVLLLLPTIAVAAGAAALSLRLGHPVAWAALREMVRDEPSPARSRALLADLAPLLVEVDAPGLPVDIAHAVEHGDRRRLEELVADLDIVIAMGDGGPQARPGAVFVPLERLIPAGARTLALFGVPALYFTLAHRGRRGRTLGKRLLGISVHRLDGEALSLLDSLERFGGYFGIPGTVGIGLVELWKHPLRQLGHDRGAGTIVVLDARSASTAAGGSPAPTPGPSRSPAAPRPAGGARGKRRRRRK